MAKVWGGECLSLDGSVVAKVCRGECLSFDGFVAVRFVVGIGSIAKGGSCGLYAVQDFSWGVFVVGNASR